MPAYMIVEAEITDMARFRAYAERNPELVARHGGRYLAMRTLSEPLEGDWGGLRVVLSEWPDMDAARRYWNSPEYAALKELRSGTGRFRVILVDGINKEPLE
jgi:uncharacterized protein (DUF1330 family)